MARDWESNAKARSSIALKRCHTARENYMELLGYTHSDARSLAASTVSQIADAWREGRRGHISSDVEDAVCDIDQEWLRGDYQACQGMPGKREAEEMDLA